MQVYPEVHTNTDNASGKSKYVMNNRDFIKQLKNIADNHKTIYALGMFGQPITKAIIDD